jgi:hypothetical protein
MVGRDHAEEELSPMMAALVVRRLKPDTYDDFRRAWEPEPKQWTLGLAKVWLVRSDDDADVVATWSLFDLDEMGYEMLRDHPEWISAESRRAERMSPYEDGVVASGFFVVLEEVGPPA